MRSPARSSSFAAASSAARPRTWRGSPMPAIVTRRRAAENVQCLRRLYRDALLRRYTYADRGKCGRTYANTRHVFIGGRGEGLGPESAALLGGSGSQRRVRVEDVGRVPEKTHRRSPILEVRGLDGDL